jgi:hypothetical protein
METGCGRVINEQTRLANLHRGHNWRVEARFEAQQLVPCRGNQVTQ